MKCELCPKACKADRTVTVGFCGASAEPEVSTICVHQGEEPPICGKKGICNVFFAHCNLQCIYCQNGDISTLSDPTSALIRYRGVDAIVEGIAQTLKRTENIVGFVTPTHYANHIPAIVEGLHQRGLSPITVYNTGGYESINTLQMLAPYIDIYLPDFKYMDPQLALRYSHAQDYPTVALKALKEMYNQKGSALPTDDDGLAYRGIIVRLARTGGKLPRRAGRDCRPLPQPTCGPDGTIFSAHRRASRPAWTHPHRGGICPGDRPFLCHRPPPRLGARTQCTAKFPTRLHTTASL